LTNDLTAKGHVTTGIVGVAALYPVLSMNGQQDLALRLVQDVTYPSYGWMFTNEYENATTMWELWNAPLAGPGMNSRNHHMFSSIGAWFWRYVVGLDLTGSSTFNIHPYLPFDASLMPELNAEHMSRWGMISVEYQRDPAGLAKNSIRLTVRIPANCHAHLSFEPLVENGALVSLAESGVKLWDKATDGADIKLTGAVEGIEWLRPEPESAVVTARVSSGHYRFEAEWN